MRGFILGDMLLKMATPSDLHDPIIGDLHERFYQLQETHGRKAASRYYYRDLFASLPSLAWRRVAIVLHGRWLSSFGAGLIAFLAVFGILQLAGRLGSHSAALTYAVMIAATCALCVVPRVAKTAGVLVLFLCVAAWTATFFMSHPIERVELRSLAFYLRFIRLGLAMLGAVLVSLLVRRNLGRARTV